MQSIPIPPAQLDGQPPRRPTGTKTVNFRLVGIRGDGGPGGTREARGTRHAGTEAVGDGGRELRP